MTTRSRRRRCRAPCVGLRGPLGRAISTISARPSPGALGIGFFGLVIGGAASGFMEQLANSPDFIELLSTVFPDIDYRLRSAGSSSSLFVEFGLILAGLAAATFVGGWASDETSGRLEMLLATPLPRPLGAVAGGVGDARRNRRDLRGAHRGRHRDRRGDAPVGDVVTPVARDAGPRPVRGSRWPAIGFAVGGVVGTRFADRPSALFVDPDLVRPAARARCSACPTSSASSR